MPHLKLNNFLSDICRQETIIKLITYEKTYNAIAQELYKTSYVIKKFAISNAVDDRVKNRHVKLSEQFRLLEKRLIFAIYEGFVNQ